IAVPGSVVDNAQSKELKTVLVGQIARAAAVFQVDEIVVYDDGMGSARAKESGWNPNDFMARLEHLNRDLSVSTLNTSICSFAVQSLLYKSTHAEPKLQSPPPPPQYVETPQYLRRQLIPMHPDLKFAGLLAPLDAPHHVRAGEWSAYREGVVVERPASAPSRAGDSGSFVYIGTKREARIDRKLAAGMRVTVALHPEDVDPAKRSHRGTAVAASRPREERGLYWGYSTRLAATLGDVIAGGPYAGGYDLTLGTSERGHATLDDEGFGVRPFKHALIVFGGVQGIEASIDNDESLEMPGADAHTLFDMWVNIAPRQGSRTIRTEEAVLITLARLQGPILRAVGDA
ncbi:putative RNA methyltransferase, partial [Tribonema minus]